MNHSPIHRQAPLRLARSLTFLALLSVPLLCFCAGAEEKKPHVVFVVGTHHYSPELTMPVFAKAIEAFGFRSTVVMGEGDPERKDEPVLPGIEALADADLAVFFIRFLTLQDKEWQAIETYLKSGKPVIGLRTSNHGFKYPREHPRYKWNDDFGRRALGSPYIVHQGGSTAIKLIEKHAAHPVLRHVKKTDWTSPGTLYLAIPDKSCVPLAMGSGKGKPRLVTKDWGEIQVKEFETAAVTWAWHNEWGGKSLYTSLGHPGDFAEEAFVRTLINAVCWTTDRPLPAADAKIPTWQIQRADRKKKKRIR
jgi:type 1 glutamine amidotransferase